MEQIKSPHFTPIDRIIQELNQDCVYHMQTLSGHSPENGRYVFQPTLSFDSPSTSSGRNEVGLSYPAIEAYGALLTRAFAMAGIEAQVEVVTYPSHHIVVNVVE